VERGERGKEDGYGQVAQGRFYSLLYTLLYTLCVSLVYLFSYVQLFYFIIYVSM